jgi:RNA polymerase sigma factor (sigma-70 family)
MSPESSPGNLSVPEILDRQLLEEVQACLRCRKRGEIPSDTQKQALDRFCAVYTPLLRCFAAACGVAKADLDDCCQDAWLEALRQLPAFHSDGTQRGLCSWLHTIVHGKAVDLLRYRSRHPSRRLNGRAEARIVDGDAGPEALCAQLARQKAVQQILATLQKEVSDLTYAAFYNHCVEGQSLKQIAAQLNLTERKLWCRIYDAKKKFRLLCAQPAYKALLDDG